jgi:hypothetical protein
MVPGLGQFDRAVSRLEGPHFDITDTRPTAIGARLWLLGGHGGLRCGPLAEPACQLATGLVGAALDLGETEGGGVLVEGGELLRDPIDERLEAGILGGIDG